MAENAKKISATIITLNEEKNISSCLESLDFVDEIVVVDSGSTDRTGEICRGNPKVRFHDLPWEGYGRQKNLAASLASHDWILNIDADERVSEPLRASILAADRDLYAGFRMARRNYFGSRWIRWCGWYPDRKLRFYDRSRGSFEELAVHEAVKCRDRVGLLSGDLHHYTYDGISDYMSRMDRYSSLAAEEMLKQGRRPGLPSILFRPPYTFFRMYLLKLGFLEGYTGLLLSLLYTGYTFLKYAKATETIRNAARQE